MNKNIKLPYDLEKYAKKQFLKRLLPFVIIEAVVCVAILLWGAVIFKSDYPAFTYFCYVLCLMSPFFITGFPLNLNDSSFCGELTHVEVKTSLAVKDDRTRPGYDSNYYKNTVWLHISTADGKKLRVRTQEAAVGQKRDFDRYKVGDKIFHLYGTDIYVKLPDDATDLRVSCPVCGESNERGNHNCRNCSHTLIKYEKDLK